MAMLASLRSPYGTATTTSQKSSREMSDPTLQAQHSAHSLQDPLFMSPTEAEFAEYNEGLESVRSWDERRVGEWLKSIKCGQYETLFRQHNFTGESLLECDQKILSEIGIKKIGDRVRINVAIKQLRSRSAQLRRREKQSVMEALDTLSSTSSSPRQHSSRASNRRLDNAALKPSSRPSSPFADTHLPAIRSRYAVSSSMESRRDASAGYLSQPASASTTNGKPPDTPTIIIRDSAGKSHLRQNSSVDGITAGGLPSNSPVIKIVHNEGQTKVVNVKFCKSADEVTMTVLKKLLIPEKLFRNYCFYVLDGLEARPDNCRRLSDEELMAICGDAARSERNRLILRKINDGMPQMEDVKKAAKLAQDESQAMHSYALTNTNMRNQIKLQQLTGESWSSIQAPLSPLPITERQKHVLQTAQELERTEVDHRRPRDRAPESRIRTFYGARPPSEMIVQELTSYFPSHQKDEIERTMRLSVRRSQRMSRAASRLSVVSNFSVASSLADAPPVPAIPSIADQWLQKPGATSSGAKARPVSISRLHPAWRDSVASSNLSPLAEELSSPAQTESNRKSYVSFSTRDSPSASPIIESFYSEPPTPTFSHGRTSMLVGDDPEEDTEEDPALTSFLAGGNSFEKNNWMKGDLIGEGSFGSVYLALHAITGELMAVKQVELPEIAKGSESDKRKQSMISALKQEIQLLQGLHHPHIVQYLGTSSDETHLNIFLEYVPGGSIAGMLKQYNTFPEQLARNFTRQILEGLAYLHSRNIIHRDIKGANVLVDHLGAVKISDFGVSKQTTSNIANSSAPESSTAPSNSHSRRASIQGSVFWMAPEVVRQSGQSIKSDIWSVGCLIVEMLTGERPFPSMSTVQTLFAVGSGGQKPRVPDDASAEARAFLEKCFETDATKRPTANELLREPWCRVGLP